jgi:hemoglobin/transferrin/lactoferrin receptor protein
VAAGIIVLSSGVAFAQQIQLEGIVVTTSKVPTKAIDSPSPSSSVGRAKAQRVPTPVAATGPVEPGEPIGARSVAGASQLDLIQPQSIADAINDIPGVASQVNADDPGQAINIRGLQDFGRVNVTVDGARQNFQKTGHNANGQFYLDPEFLSRIDITRGPTSTVYGSGAIGGVAAFTTRDVNDVLSAGETAAFEQKTAIGTNGIGWVSSSSAGLRVGRNVDVYGQFVGRDTNTYDNGNGDIVINSDYEDYGGLAKLAVRPEEGAQITASALIQRYDFLNGNGLDVENPMRDSNVKADTYTLGYTFARPDTPLLDFSAKAYYTTTSNDQEQVFPLTNPLRTRSFEIETTGFDVFNTSRFKTAMLGHTLTYGVDGFQDEVTVIDGFSTADLFTPNGERSVYGGFVEDEVLFTSWLRVIGALRYDTYELEGGGTQSDGSHLSPKATVAVKPITGIEVYGSFAEGYRAPALTETLVSGIHPPFAPGFPDAFTFVPNAGLQPEIGQNKEIGANLKYDSVFMRGDKFRAKVSAYRNDVSDYIELVEFGPPIVSCPPGVPLFVCQAGFVPFITLLDYSFVQYQNIADARLEGAELELAYDWGGGFVQVAATHTRGENRETGGPLNTIPPDRVITTLGFRFLNEKLVAGTRITAVDHSDPDLDSAIAPPTSGYALVDLFGSYQFNEDVSLDGIIYNVFDQQYRQFLYLDDSPGVQGKLALTIRFPADGVLGGK